MYWWISCHTSINVKENYIQTTSKFIGTVIIIEPRIISHIQIYKTEQWNANIGARGFAMTKDALHRSRRQNHNIDHNRSSNAGFYRTAKIQPQTAATNHLFTYFFHIIWNDIRWEVLVSKFAENTNLINRCINGIS